jgi:hypothetical protein
MLVVAAKEMMNISIHLMLHETAINNFIDEYRDLLNKPFYQAHKLTYRANFKILSCIQDENKQEKTTRLFSFSTKTT